MGCFIPSQRGGSSPQRYDEAPVVCLMTSQRGGIISQRGGTSPQRGGIAPQCEGCLPQCHFLDEIAVKWND